MKYLYKRTTAHSVDNLHNFHQRTGSRGSDADASLGSNDSHFASPNFSYNSNYNSLCSFISPKRRARNGETGRKVRIIVDIN